MDRFFPWTADSHTWLAACVVAIPWALAFPPVVQRLQKAKAFFPSLALVVFAATLAYYALVRNLLISGNFSDNREWLSLLLVHLHDGPEFRLVLAPSFEGAVFGLAACGLVLAFLVLAVLKPSPRNTAGPEILAPFALALLLSMFADALALSLTWSLMGVRLFFPKLSRRDDTAPIALLHLGWISLFSLVFSVLLLAYAGTTLDLTRLFSADACRHFSWFDGSTAPARYAGAMTLGLLSWLSAMGGGMILPWFFPRREAFSTAFAVPWLLFLLSGAYLAFRASPCLGIEASWLSIEILWGFLALALLSIALAWLRQGIAFPSSNVFSRLGQTLSALSAPVRRILRHPLGFVAALVLGLAALLLISVFFPTPPEMP